MQRRDRILPLATRANQVTLVSPNHGRFLLHLSPACRGFFLAREASRARAAATAASKSAMGSTLERLPPCLRPTRWRRRPLRGQGVDAALDAQEPAVDVAQQNFRCIRDGGSDVCGAPRALR